MVLNLSEQIEDLVTHLEEARIRGGLESAIETAQAEAALSPIADTYQRFTGSPWECPPFRAQHVRSVIRHATWRLRKPEVVFPAVMRTIGGASAEDEGTRLAGTTIEAAGSALRLDQAVEARYWAIGFSFDQDKENDLFERLVLKACVANLGRLLRDLEIIERDRHWMRAPRPTIHPPRKSIDFEQLVCDVLNEEARRARHAPLLEDLLEQTDLRVQVEGVKRRRGSRVQVTRTIDPVFYQEKVARLRHADEFVVLSPASLARFMSESSADWRPAGEARKANEFILTRAKGIRTALYSALARERRHRSPRGPLDNVPDDLRRLIRTYVDIEAARATRKMRQRHVLRQ